MSPLGGTGQGEGEGSNPRAGPQGRIRTKLGKSPFLKNPGLQNLARKLEHLRPAFTAACSVLVPTQGSALKLPAKFPISTN